MGSLKVTLLRLDGLEVHTSAFANRDIILFDIRLDLTELSWKLRKFHFLSFFLYPPISATCIWLYAEPWNFRYDDMQNFFVQITQSLTVSSFFYIPFKISWVQWKYQYILWYRVSLSTLCTWLWHLCWSDTMPCHIQLGFSYIIANIFSAMCGVYALIGMLHV